MLVRNGENSKDLQYWDFTITAPKVGSGDLTRELYEQITSITSETVVISSDIMELSAALSGLSGDFWPQGGDNSNCYGSSIGNSNGTKVIDLDN